MRHSSSVTAGVPRCEGGIRIGVFSRPSVSAFSRPHFPDLHSVIGPGYLPLEQCQSGGFSHPLSRSALVQKMKLLGPPVQIGFRHLPAVLLPQLQEPLVGLVGVNLSSPLPARGLCSDSLGFAIPALSPE